MGGRGNGEGGGGGRGRGGDGGGGRGASSAMRLCESRAAMTIALTPAAATSIVQAATSGQHIAHERARGGGGALACSMSSGASGPPCSSSRFE